MANENKKLTLQVVFWLVLAALLLFSVFLVDYKYFSPQISQMEEAISAGIAPVEMMDIDFAELKEEIAGDKRFGALILQAEAPIAIDKTKINKKENPFK